VKLTSPPARPIAPSRSTGHAEERQNARVSGCGPSTRQGVLSRGLGAAVLTLVVGPPPASALDPTRALTQYSRETWTSRTGLPQDSIQAITQTEDGHLWLATPAGLVRFDGMRFVAIGEGRTAPDVWSLIRARDGSLWMGTEGGGLLRYREGQFSIFSEAQGLTSSLVRTLLEARDGGLWIATDGGGVNRLEDGRISSIRVQDGLPGDRVWSLCEDRRGRLWIGTNGSGLAVLENGRVRALPRRGLYSDPFAWVIHEDPDGAIWVGTSSGLLRIDSTGTTRFTRRDGLAGDTVRAILTDRHGSLWVGTTEGLSRYRNGSFETLPRQGGLASSFVRSLFEDRDGNLWVGTFGGGLDLIRDGLFTAYGEPEGVSGAVARTVLESKDGSIWVGTNNGGITRLGAGRPRAWTTREGLSSNVATSSCEDPGGRIWVGTNGWGLNVIGRDGAVTRPAVPLPSPFVRTLHCAADGRVWAGTSRGLARISGTEVRTFTRADGLPDDFVRSFHAGASGRIWVGTMSGVGALENGTFRALGRRDGVPGDQIESILEDEGGVVWIATNGGLARIRNGEVSSVPLQPVMPDGLIHSMQADRLGNLWFSSARGVFRFSKAALEAAADRKGTPIIGSVYDSFDGMRTIECAGGGYHPASARDSRGRIWFPTARGVVVVDPDAAAVLEPAPPVRLESTTLDDRVLDLESTPMMPPNPGRLAFHFGALSLVTPKNVHFRYRLAGYEREWVDGGRGRVAAYTNLPPGQYAFEVAARRREGPWSEPPASRAFRIQPAFTQTWWFAAVVASLLGLGVWGGIAFRVRSLRAREQHAEALVAERTRELREQIEQRQTIEQGLRESELEKEGLIKELERRNAELERFTYTVSHDLRSPLVTMQGFLGYLEAHATAGRIEDLRRDVDRIRSATVRMSDLLRDLLELSRIGRVANPAEDLPFGSVAREAVEMVQGLAAQRGARIEIADDMPVVRGDHRRLVEVVQNLLENAVKFSGSAGKPRIEVGSRGRDGDGKAVLFVRDNGIGIEPCHLDRVFGLFDKLDPGIEGTGVGLAIVKRITEVHGGRVWAESEGPGTGATFCFTLPLAEGDARPS
jgi:ligand-binding sensor domain-containing protein/signal transduction histidine kinase